MRGLSQAQCQEIVFVEANEVSLQKNWPPSSQTFWRDDRGTGRGKEISLSHPPQQSLDYDTIENFIYRKERYSETTAVTYSARDDHMTDCLGVEKDSLHSLVGIFLDWYLLCAGCLYYRLCRSSYRETEV